MIAIAIGLMIFTNTGIINSFKLAGDKENLDGQERVAEDTEIGKQAIISEAKIIDRKTGVGPWDENDEPGNDSSAENNIVRSFDQVTWTIENTMSLKNEEANNSYSGGTIEVKAEVPENLNNLVKWDIDSMQWAKNTNISDDGRIFTAQYEMTTEQITIPGKQTLVLVLKILGAENGTEIIPTFTLNLLGNNEEESIQVAEENDIVKVSAAPKYNVKLISGNNTRETLNFDGNEKTGRIYGYGIALQLYNDNASKGLKGIEYPTGDITFDIDLLLQRSKVDSEEIEDITDESLPLLWNYKINGYGSPIISDRKMTGDINNEHLPNGKRRNTQDIKNVYESGNITMTQEGRKIKVKISDYAFDGIFPPLYGNNVGCFNATYFQVFLPDSEATDIENRDYYFNISDSNFSTIVQDKNVTTQVITTDDSITQNYTKYNKGSYSHFIDFKPSTNIPTDAGRDGQTVLTPGEKFVARVTTTLDTNMDSDYYVYSLDKIFLFDADAFEITGRINRGNKDMSFKIWAITKKDGTNWNSQEEMNTTTNITDFDFYDEVEDIPEGKTCIGIYIESDGGFWKPTYNVIEVEMKIKDDAHINKTYGMVQTTKLWDKEHQIDRSIYTCMNQEHPEYPTPTCQIGSTYVKTEYNESGTIIAGTHKGSFSNGNTVLVVGARQSVNIETIDESQNNKVNFDLGKNEYEVTYKITPTLAIEKAENSQLEDVNVTLTNTLQKGLTYMPGTSNYGEPENITKDRYGNMVLVWKIPNCSTGKDIEPLIYKAKINEETENGKQYENKVVISSDKIQNDKETNRTSIANINIINLSSYSLYKTTENSAIEKNGEASYKVTFINKTDNPISDFQLLDIMPYNGDNRGSKFNGKYTVTNMKLEQKDNTTGTNVYNSTWKIHLTDDVNIRNGVNVKDENLRTNTLWRDTLESEQALAEGGINNIYDQLAAYAITGEFPANSKLTITITMQTQDNKPEDIYINNASAQTNKDTEAIQTANIPIQVIKRKISGKVWLDENKDGLMQDSEQSISGIKIKLLKTNQTPAIDIYGNEITETTTDEDGNYYFEDMEPNIYNVMIYLQETKYQLTIADVGTDSKINSKFNMYNSTDACSRCDVSNEEANMAYINKENINAGLIEKYDIVKTTTTPEISTNGELSYTVTFANKSNNSTDYLQLLDILPYNGDDRGSNFNGDYIVKNMKITEEKISTGNPVKSDHWDLYLTDKEDVRNGVYVTDEDITNHDIWDENSIESKKALAGEIDINKKLTAYAIVGYLNGNSKITITINMQSEGNKVGDIYKNNVTAHNEGEKEYLQSEIIPVEVTKSSVLVHHYIEGTTEKLAEDQVIEGIVGEEYLTNEAQNIEEGYRLSKRPDNAVGTMQETQTEVIYYYSKNYSYKIEYYYDNILNTEKTENKTGEYNTQINDYPPKLENGYKLDQVDGLPLTIGKDESKNIIKVYYIRKDTSILVHHYIEGTTTPVGLNNGKEAEDVIINGKVFDDYNTTPLTNIASKYELVGTPTNAQGKMAEEQIIVTYYYRVKNSTLTIKYLEVGTEEELLPQETKTGKVDETYEVSETPIENYELVQTLGNKTGKYTIEPTTIIFYYKQKTRVIVNHIDKTTNQIIETISEDGLVGEQYTATSKNFENYVLVERPEQETITMTKDEIILNYYYSYISAGVIEKHIDVISGDVLDNNTYTGNEGDSYNIPSKTFEGYDLVENRLPNNAQGKMGRDVIEVNYYYIKKGQVITEYIDKVTGNKLTEDVTKNGHENDKYTTENKTFDDYDLIKVPENATGTMIGGTIKVTYEYVHKSAGVVERHYDIKTNELLEKETKYTGHEGDEYTTNAKEFNGYDLVEEKMPENATGTMTIEEIQVNYYYIKKAKVTTKYVDKISNKEISETTEQKGHIGDEYTTTPKEIEEYELIKEEIPQNASGTMDEEETIVTYYYVRKAEVETRYIDKTTGKELSDAILEEGYEGNDYKTESKEIEFYKLVETPKNATGKYKIDVTKQEDGSEIINKKTIVTYYYEPLKFNLKIKKDISKIMVDGQEQDVLDLDLPKIEINRKKLNDTNVKVEYLIKVINDGELEGKATIAEMIPDDFEMKLEENEGWTFDNGTAQLVTDNIKPGETKEIKVVLEWKQGEDTLGTKENIANLISTENKAGFKETTEDDNKDNATLILSIATGEPVQYIVAVLMITTLVGVVIGLQGKRKVE